MQCRTCFYQHFPSENASLNNNKSTQLYTLLSLEASQVRPNSAAPLVYAPEHRGWTKSNNQLPPQSKSHGAGCQPLVSLRTASLRPRTADIPSAKQPAGCGEGASLSTDSAGAQHHLQAPVGGDEAKGVPGKRAPHSARGPPNPRLGKQGPGLAERCPGTAMSLIRSRRSRL